jgi:hypothetical protein
LLRCATKVCALEIGFKKFPNNQNALSMRLREQNYAGKPMLITY